MERPARLLQLSLESGEPLSGDMGLLHTHHI